MGVLTAFLLLLAGIIYCVHVEWLFGLQIIFAVGAFCAFAGASIRLSEHMKAKPENKDAFLPKEAPLSGVRNIIIAFRLQEQQLFSDRVAVGLLLSMFGTVAATFSAFVAIAFS